MLTPDQVLAVLKVAADADDFESLFWRFDDGQISMFANCSDFFAWATADCEEITGDDDITGLRQALTDLREVGADWHWPALWVARKRKMRPQKPCYKDMTPTVAALFDACCTVEERAEFDRKDTQFWLGVAAHVRRQKETCA